MNDSLSTRFTGNYKGPCRLLTSVACVLVMTVAGLVLLGWIFNLPMVESVFPGLATMKFNTALCFVLSGMALWFRRKNEGGSTEQRIGHLCAALVLVIALLTLGEYLFGWNVGVDELFVRDLATNPHTAPPGRMSVATDICFLLFGLGLLSLDVGSGQRYCPSHYFALLGTLFALIALEGYIFGVQALYSFFIFSSVAIHTAILFFLLGLGLLMARANRGLMAVVTGTQMGGRMARRALPWVIGVPVFIAWLCLKGEQSGFYDTEIELVIFTTGNIFIFAALIWLAARSLNQLHAELNKRNLINAHFTAIIESSVDAIIGKDLNSNITSWNAGAEKVFGYSASEIIGQSIKRLIPPDRQKEEEEIISRIRDGERVEPFETLRLRKDGQLIHVSVTISPIKDSDGRIVGASKIARDITKRVKAETALRTAEEAIRIQAEDLARSNKDLEQFAYVASHDLQEPLRAVAGSLQLMQRRYRGKLDAQADEFIGHAVDGAHRMQTLIEGLLAFSRVGTRGGDFEPVSGDEALDNALKNLATAIQESEAVITRDKLPTLKADPLQLALLFQNLVGNAIKFRGDKPPQIHIGVEHKDGCKIISVRDNGIGIEPQYFERIFVIFQRLHTRREYPGTGIGLAICKKIVERHGGHISVESSPGQGCVFHCSFPAA